MLIAILFVYLLSGCASVPDVPICAELTPTKGYCTYTVSNKEMIVDDTDKLNGETWWEQRWKMVLVPVESWVKIKSAFIKMCRKSKSCSENIDSWDRKSTILEGGTPAP